MEPATPERNSAPEHDPMDDLNHAIDSTSSDMLRSILVAVCKTDPSVRQTLADLLLVSVHQVPNVPSGIPASDYGSADEEEKQPAKSEKPGDQQQTTGSKRSLPRYATCASCGKEFDVTENTKNSCTYHPDGGYPNPDFFFDHDEDCHGPMDSDENRKEFPEAFIYECCKESGIDPCTTGWHREAQPKRTRVD
ncbi:uncharacterized protein LDX57_002886 [Aspergillus melleus]|uniref:uncharacterized protein n=1 Tax=Aspergillus melleus TaxID=138277 RepID=UPI001E8E9A61|nr:uncharacterized protein LDX57_002886 [Aspergillus melleus]KAH8425137.1 hypothetical protein LDX57_002886 [Aspergillus melleus]